MKQWNQVINLAAMELKGSLVNLLLCWLALPLFGIMILFEIGIRLSEGNVGIPYDVIFLVLFSSAPFLFRAKHFKYNKVSGNLWASPTLIMQSQLPIPKDILFKSRFIIYLTYYVPASVVIFVVSYMISSDLRTVLSPSTYITFAIIWFFIGLSLGIIYPASDVGDIVTPKITFVYMILLVVALSLAVLFFKLVIGTGIVSFTIFLANEHRVIAVGLSLILLISSWIYWPYYMKWKMQRLDYL